MPTWSDNVSVVAEQVLAKGATVRGTIDLRTLYGAHIFLKIGRGGTAAFVAGCKTQIRRVINNDGASVGAVHPNYINPTVNTTAATGNTTVNVTSSSGQAVLQVASVTGFAGGDFICIQDSGGGVTRLEFHRVSKINASTLVLDRNLSISHTSGNADTVRNKAEVFAPIWVDGGSLIEVIFDYGLETTGDNVTVQALAQTYNS